jgi:hypothetical protein
MILSWIERQVSHVCITFSRWKSAWLFSVQMRDWQILDLANDPGGADRQLDRDRQYVDLSRQCFAMVVSKHNFRCRAIFR